MGLKLKLKLDKLKVPILNKRSKVKKLLLKDNLSKRLHSQLILTESKEKIYKKWIMIREI